MNMINNIRLDVQVSRMIQVVERFHTAISMNHKFVAVALLSPNTQSPEVIINEDISLYSKLKYYENTYDESLNHRHVPGCKIVAVTSSDTYEGISANLYYTHSAESRCKVETKLTRDVELGSSCLVCGSKAETLGASSLVPDLVQSYCLDCHKNKYEPYDQLIHALLELDRPTLVDDEISEDMLDTINRTLTRLDITRSKLDEDYETEYKRMCSRIHM